VFDKDGYVEALKKYHREENKCVCRFQEALEKEHGLENHPKKDVLFGHARNRGHASSLNEVALVFDELSELLKD
jgi:hypothetical protein